MFSLVPKSHFKGKTRGYYYKSHINPNNRDSFYYELPPIQVLLPGVNSFTPRIKKEDNDNIVKIGQKGILTFIADDNETNIFIYDDLETKTTFKSIIKDEFNHEYDINCRLWKPKGDKIRIFCNLDENLKYEKQNIMLNIITFIYKDYEITIIQNDYIEVEQLKIQISFLYYEKQILEINEYENAYNINLNIESYDNELLYIFGDNNNYSILDKCSINDKQINTKYQKKI